MNVQGDYEPADATGFININSLRSVQSSRTLPDGGEKLPAPQGSSPSSLGLWG